MRARISVLLKKHSWSVLVVCFFLQNLSNVTIAAESEGEVENLLGGVRHNIAERLASMKGNQALLLGQAKVVGDFNSTAYRFGLNETGPLARDYSIKMVWAPDRKRALFTGANHGRPHRLNDVWEFDLSILSWILLYPPDNPRSYAGLGDDAGDVIFERGVLRTKRGGPVVIGHSWWGISYDEKNRLLMFMSTWDTNQKSAIRQLGGDPASRYQGPPLWSFDPEKRIWKAIKSQKPYPRAPFGGLLEYIPDNEGLVWHTNHWQMRATWVFNPGENAWTKAISHEDSVDFIKTSPKPEQVGYYDSKRKLIVAQRGGDTFHFDSKRGVWSHVLSKPDGVDDWPSGHDAYTPFYYNPATGKGIFVDFRTNQIWSYDPSNHTWAKVLPYGDQMPRGAKRLAYFDAQQNVFVVIDGIDVWVYRPI